MHRIAAIAALSVASLAHAQTDSYPLKPVRFMVGQAPGDDPQKDLIPVTLLAEAPFLLVVHPSLPVKNVRELIALAKSKRGELNFGSGGNGSSGHLARGFPETPRLGDGEVAQGGESRRHYR